MHKRYIKHLAEVLILKAVHLNKHRNDMIGNRFEMPTLHISYRLGALTQSA